MRINRTEAQSLIDSYCQDVPLSDALERALDHDWEHDPRTDQIGEDHTQTAHFADCQHEVDHVLYGV